MKSFKTLSVLFMLLCFSFSAFSQKRDDAVFFLPKDQIKKFHTLNDLQNLKKGELLDLYSKRFHEIIAALPYIALTNEPGVRLSDIGIKEDHDHKKLLKKNVEESEDYLETTNETIENLIAYADTERLILSILYYEEIIKQLRMGVQNSF